MNKKELVAAIADKTEMTKTNAEAVLTAITEVIIEGLAKGEEITLGGLGKFSVKERAARTGRNPQTGATIEIPASKGVGFKAAKAVKEAVKNS